MCKRLVIAVALGIIAVMIGVPILVVFDVIALNEGGDPLAVLVLLWAVLTLVLGVVTMVWVAVSPWVRKKQTDEQEAEQKAHEEAGPRQWEW